MKKIISLILLASSISFAQQPAPWRPTGFNTMGLTEQRLINNLQPLSNSNKMYAQLFLDMGKYKNCGVGTALTADKIYFTLVDKATGKKHRHVLELNKSLVSENEFGDEKTHLYVLVFETPSKEQGVVSETLFMLLSVKEDGSGVLALQIEARKNFLNNVVPPKAQTHYSISCEGI